MGSEGRAYPNRRRMDVYRGAFMLTPLVPLPTGPPSLWVPAHKRVAGELSLVSEAGLNWPGPDA